MRLLLDAGNTYLKLGFSKDGEIVDNLSVSNREISKKLSSHIKKSKVKIDEAYIVSVNNDNLNRTLKELYKLNIAPKIFKKSDVVFKTEYKTNTLGDDRIVTDYGAFKIYGGGLIVIDLGTAATFDIISKEGIHLGGAIMPGKETYSFSLLKTAKALPEAYMEKTFNPIGKTTEDNLKIGLYNGFMGSVIHMINEYKKMPELKDYKVVLTGGDTFMFKDVKEIDIFDSMLTLKALDLIYK